jgi:opacity protein-like surface antigen
MKNILFSACAAIALTMGASAASADDNRYYDDNGYYSNGDNSWRYQNDDYGDNGGYGYSQDVVSPRSVVQSLQQQGFSYITRPALSGRFYQVKARDPNGHKVKLYIDAYSGRIVKVKG